MRRRCWEALLAVAKRIGRVQAWMILTLCYVLLVTPVALIFKFVADPLHLRRKSGSIWTSSSEPVDGLAWAKTQ